MVYIYRRNEHSGQKKTVGHYFENQPTKEFIKALLDEENRQRNTDNGTLSDIYDKKRGGITKGSTWMHPLLFIDFAMWLNPTFKVQVLKFVYDELIKYRNDAGDAYREMSEAIAKLSKKGETAQNIKKVAEALNHIASGAHEKMIRNKADENQMREYVRLEKEITMLINRGFIDSFDKLLNHLRREWNLKYKPKVFQTT